MVPRPIRGIVIKTDRQIGAVLITGSRTRMPLIAIGQFHRGQGASKVYSDEDFHPSLTEGIDFTSIRIDREATVAIVNADPNSDKGMYVKVTERPSQSGAEAYGCHFEVDNRGTMGAIRGVYAQVRNRTGEIESAIRGFFCDVKQDVGGTLTGTAEGMRIQMNVQANAPAGSAGIVIRNICDGNYTEPRGIDFQNAATSGCQGWISAINYESDALQGLITTGNCIVSEDGDAVLIVRAGAPSDGNYNDLAKKGCLLIDITNARLYMNVGTKAATNWDYVSATWT